MILCILRPYFFFVENDFFKPTQVTEVWKIPHFFYFLSHIQTSIAFFIDVCIMYFFVLIIWICIFMILFSNDQLCDDHNNSDTCQRHQCLSPGPDTCFSGTNTRPWLLGSDLIRHFSFRSEIRRLFMSICPDWMLLHLYPEFWTGFLKIRNWPF